MKVLEAMGALHNVSTTALYRSDRFAGGPDRLESGPKRRVANQPVPLHVFVQTMVLAKQVSTEAVTQRRPGQTFGELLHSRARENPDAPALFCNDRKMSSGDLDESSTQLARWLIEQGLKPGERVALY